MKKLIALLLIAPFLQGCEQKTPVGRFQIVTGMDDEATGGALGQPGTFRLDHDIFKIDTVTGQSWLYSDGKWSEIKDLPSQ